MSTAHVGWTVGGALMAAGIIAATTWSAGVHGAAADVVHTAASTATTPSATPSPVVTPATATTPPPPALPAAEEAATRTELAALAGRLPAHLTLTAPAGWAQYSGGTAPEYDEDISSCPRVTPTLGVELGQKWTYAFGKLPTGPAGCTWTPVPWVPDRSPADRLFVSIGFQQGPVAELMSEPGYCGRGSLAPELAVPALAPGAVLSGCLDENGTGLGVAVPDPAGTGVWTISTSGGVHIPTARAASALIAAVDAARKAYR